MISFQVDSSPDLEKYQLGWKVVTIALKETDPT